MASKSKKRIHRPPAVDGMAACIVLQKGKWSRFQVGCQPVDADAVAQILSGCGPKCITDFVKNGPKKIQKKKKKPRSRDDGDDDDGFLDLGTIFSAPAIAPAPAPPVRDVMGEVESSRVDISSKDGKTTVTISEPEFEVASDRTSPFVRPFKVKAKKKIDVKKHMQARRAAQRYVDALRRRKGAVTQADAPAIQSQFDRIVDALDAGRMPVWNVKEERFDTAPSNPAAASNPTGNVSGLSSRRPTMARRKKACSVLRRQGKKLPARCKGTKRRRSR